MRGVLIVEQRFVFESMHGNVYGIVMKVSSKVVTEEVAGIHSNDDSTLNYFGDNRQAYGKSAGVVLMCHIFNHPCLLVAKGTVRAYQFNIIPDQCL